MEPDFDLEGELLYAIIHLDTMIHAAHLIGEPNGPIPTDITHTTALDSFDSFLSTNTLTTMHMRLYFSY